MDMVNVAVWYLLILFRLIITYQCYMENHPFTLDQLGPQWGSRGILQMRQSLLSSRFVLALFCIHKLEQQFGVCFILAPVSYTHLDVYKRQGLYV